MQRIIWNSTARHPPRAGEAVLGLVALQHARHRLAQQHAVLGDRAVGRRPGDVEHERLARRAAGHRVAGSLTLTSCASGISAAMNASRARRSCAAARRRASGGDGLAQRVRPQRRRRVGGALRGAASGRAARARRDRRPAALGRVVRRRRAGRASSIASTSAALSRRFSAASASATCRATSSAAGSPASIEPADAAQRVADVVVVGGEVGADGRPLHADAVEDHQDLDEPLGDGRVGRAPAGARPRRSR